jgi:transposase-like protein
MLGHGAKFGHKVEQAIAALLSHRNVEEAARAVGISANTLLRWLKEPEFDAACREARRTAFSQSIARLQDASGAAVTTVLKIMLDTNAAAGTRLRAAEVVLEHTSKAIEVEDLEARVAELERAAGSAKRSRKRSAILTLASSKALPGPAATPAEISPAPRLLAAPTEPEMNADTDHSEAPQRVVRMSEREPRPVPPAAQKVKPQGPNGG